MVNRSKQLRAGLLIILGIAAGAAVAQSSKQQREVQSSHGPLIKAYGPVFDVRNPDFVTPTDRDYRVVFDVATGPDEPDRLNPSIETVARFLNMHARAGVLPERLHVALVLHGRAGKDTLSDQAYRTRFEIENPNLKLIRALHEAGVRVVLCGQTAASRGFAKNELAAPVELALSAMTALVTLQDDGYELIAF